MTIDKAQITDNHSNTVTIPRERYHALLRSEEILELLESFGVDNWEGYSDAMREYHSNEEQQ